MPRSIHEVAARAMVLFAVFPGSFVLSFAYSEATLIVFAAACLIFLVDERWLLAGVMGALATATRPNGLAVVAACVVAAAIAIPDLTFEARKINVESFRVIEAWLTATILYVATCSLIAAGLRRLERRFPRF